MSTASDALGLLQDPEGSLQPSVPINANADQTAKLLAGSFTRDIASDANYTLVAADYQTGVLTLTSSVLTTERDIIFPQYFAPILVINDTGKTLTLKKSGQPGVALADGDSARAYCGPDDVLTASGGGGGGGGDSVTEAVTALTITSGAITLDFAGKSRASFTLALNANVTTVNFSNLAGSGLVTEFDLLITQDATGGRTFALPAALKALGGSDTAIASAANAVTLLSAKTFSNGTTWRYAMQESA